MSEKRCLDVHQIEIAALELGPQSAQRILSQDAIFGITRQIARRHTDDGLLPRIRILSGILGRDQHGLVPGRMQAATERLDRGGDAIDARKINIRDHQDAHAGSRC
jgi:hypothetical protein